MVSRYDLRTQGPRGVEQLDQATFEDALAWLTPRVGPAEAALLLDEVDTLEIINRTTDKGVDIGITQWEENEKPHTFTLSPLGTTHWCVDCNSPYCNQL